MMRFCARDIPALPTQPDDRSVYMLVARLRRKIEPNPKAPRFIVSGPGAGYKLAVEAQPAESRTALPTIGARAVHSGLNLVKDISTLITPLANHFKRELPLRLDQPLLPKISSLVRPSSWHNAER
jgi:hypothetical protein